MIIGERAKRTRHNKGLAIENQVCGVYICTMVSSKTTQSVYLDLEVAHFLRPPQS